MFPTGCFYFPALEPGVKRDWGLMQWAPHLLDLLFDSSNRSVNLHMTYSELHSKCHLFPEFAIENAERMENSP